MQIFIWITIGHRQGGAYTIKGRVAYWDGRDEDGEKAGSSAYFYTISAAHKMLMVK